MTSPPLDSGDSGSTVCTLCVLQVIDYCRQYAWREEVETRVKRATVIPPKPYKRRFRDALHRYFMASIEKYAVDCQTYRIDG